MVHAMTPRAQIFLRSAPQLRHPAGEIRLGDRALSAIRVLIGGLPHPAGAPRARDIKQICLTHRPGKSRRESSRDPGRLLVTRFIFDLDVWLTNQLGTREAGHYAATDEHVEATGVFDLEGQDRFECNSQATRRLTRPAGALHSGRFSPAAHALRSNALESHLPSETLRFLPIRSETGSGPQIRRVRSTDQ